jgi:hypothetical protein
MKRYAWLIAPILIVFYCCNSEKRVLKDTDKTQHVVSAWMKKQNFKADTVFNFIPGDTITTLLIAYDTATIHDTVTDAVDQMVITTTRTITNTIHDTVKVTLKCADGADPCALLKKSEADLVNNSIVLEEHKTGEERNKLDADKWKFRFWALVTILGILVAVVVGIKVFKPTLI